MLEQILSTKKDRYLKMGLSMAQFKAQPLDTHSFAFKVLLGSCPKTSRTSWRRAGTRELLPTISTELSSSFFKPDCSNAFNKQLAISVPSTMLRHYNLDAEGTAIKRILIKKA